MSHRYSFTQACTQANNDGHLYDEEQGHEDPSPERLRELREEYEDRKVDEYLDAASMGRVCQKF